MFDSSMILVIILLTAGYVAIAQTLCQSVRNPRLVPAVAIVTLFLYLCGVSFVSLLYIFNSYDFFILFSALVVFSCFSLLFLIYCCVKRPHETNWSAAILFLAYFGIIVYATLFVRIGTFEQSVQMIPFRRMHLAIAKENYSLMRHDILNALMFVPVGFMIPIINRKEFQKLSYSFLFGIVISTLIETTQMLTHLGMFDIDDIFSNTIGTLVGYLCSVSLYWMFFKGKHGREMN